MCWLQVCWEKCTRYFDAEERFVHLTNDTFVLTPEKGTVLCLTSTQKTCYMIHVLAAGLLGEVHTLL